MNRTLFSELVESMTQMNEIIRGTCAASRKFRIRRGGHRSAPSKDRDGQQWRSGARLRGTR